MYETYAVGCKTVTVTEAEKRLPPCIAPDGIGYGDINGDGYVTKTDGETVANYVVGNVDLTPEQQVRADVDADGVVTSTDALLIAKYAEGKINTFSVCSAKPVFSVTNFTVTPLSCEEPCDVNISITWTNTGNDTGTKTLYYTVNGVKHLLGTETLAPNASVTYAATKTGLSAGSYTICPDPNE